MYQSKAIHGVGSYELIRSPEKVWGGPDKNGSWNGMLGMLQREVSPEMEGIFEKSVEFGCNQERG